MEPLPFSEEVVRLWASQLHYASLHDLQEALQRDDEVLKFNVPSEDAAKERMIIILESLTGAYSEEAPGTVELTVSTHISSFLQSLASRCSEAPQVIREKPIPISMMLVTRRRPIDFNGNPLDVRYGHPLTAKDVCIQTIDPTRPLHHLLQVLTEVYKPMFSDRQYQTGIRAKIIDLAMEIESFRSSFPCIHLNDYIEGSVLAVCEKYRHNDVSMIAQRISPTDEHLREIKAIRNQCIPYLQIDDRLEQLMAEDNSAAKAQQFGRDMESGVQEKQSDWGATMGWVESVSQQLASKNWLVLYTVTKEKDTFRPMYDQHRVWIQQILQYLGSFPFVQAKMESTSTFMGKAAEVFNAIKAKPEKRLQKLAVSVLKEITVELAGSWFAVHMLPSTILFRCDVDSEWEASLEGSVAELTTSLDLLTSLMEDYAAVYKSLVSSQASSQGASGASAAAAHPQLKYLHKRTLFILNFLELHSLRVKQLEAVVEDTGKLQLSPEARQSLVGFMPSLRNAYRSFAEEVNQEGPFVTLWSTEPRTVEKFQRCVANYDALVSSLDNEIAQFASELFSSHHNYSSGSLSSHTASDSMQYMWVLIRFNFLTLDAVKAALVVYQTPITEQFQAIIVNTREEYLNAEFNKQQVYQLMARHCISKYAADALQEHHYVESIRKCYNIRDYLSSRGWHQLLELRNAKHLWRLNATLMDFLGFPAADRPQSGSECEGSAYALSYLNLTYPSEPGWKEDPHLHLAMQLTKEKQVNSVLVLSNELFNKDVASVRDLQNMQMTIEESLHNKLQDWFAHARTLMNSVSLLSQREQIVYGPVLAVVEVGQSAPPSTYVAGTASPPPSLLQMEVVFPTWFATLDADVFLLSTVSNEVAEYKSFLHANRSRHRLSVTLTELLHVYYSAVNGEEELLSVLAAEEYEGVNRYLSDGFDLRWEREQEIVHYVNVLSEKLLLLTAAARRVREKSSIVYQKIQRFHGHAYHPEAITQNVQDILNVTMELSVQCPRAISWVRRVQPLLDAAVQHQLRFLFGGWARDFCSMRDDPRFLEINEETSVFRLRPLRLRMKIVLKEVRLESPQAVWRHHWLLKLDEYFRWVTSLPLLYSDTQFPLHSDDTILSSRPCGCQYLLMKLPPSVLGEPLRAIERCIQETVEAEQEWYSSQQLLNVDVSVMQQRFGSDVKRWCVAIERIHAMTSRLMDATQPNKLLGGIVICAETVQKELSQKFDRVVQFMIAKFMQLLDQELHSHTQQVKDEFTRVEGFNVIHSIPDAINFLCEVPQIKMQMPERQAFVELLVSSENLLARLGVTFPDSWIHASGVQQEFVSLEDMIARRMKALHIRRPLLLEEAAKMAKEIDSAVQLAEEQLREINQLSGEAPGQVETVVKDLYTGSLDLLHRVERLHLIQDALGLPQLSTERISRLQTEANILQEVWSRVMEIDEQLYAVGRLPLATLQPQAIHEKLQGMETQMAAFPVSLKTFKVFQRLSEKVQFAINVRRYMFDLCSDAMMPLERAQRHWITLKERLQVSWLLEELTVSDIWTSDPLHNAAVYNEVLEAAQGERRIDQQLVQITTFWDSYRFSMTIYKKQTCLVRGWDALFDKLVDDLGTCSSMRASPFFNVPQLVSAVKDVEGRLNRLRQTLEVLMDVQKHWVYLEGIFTGNAEIRLQLPLDTIQFERTSKELIAILPRPKPGGVSPDVSAQYFLQDEKLCQKLERLASQISGVQRALADYLDSQRRHFPRFFFVGDDDLLEVMGSGSDPEFMSRHLRKMFTALAAFRVEPETLRLLGFSSVEGEQVDFNSPIQVQSKAMHDWLSEAEEGMTVALRSQLAVAFDELLAAGSVSQEWLSRHCTQVLCLSLQIWWVTVQENQFKQKKDKLSSTQKAVELMDTLLSQLASSVLDPSLQAFIRHRCEQMITIAVYQRDVSRTVADVVSAKDFQWSRVLRFYLVREKSVNLLCCMADTSISHGFEYIGAYERLVQTPLTDRCYFTLTQALHTRMGGSPVGPAGTGKTETVKALGMQLGRHVLVFNCDDTFDYQAVSRIFFGLCQVGAWGCFDEFNRLEERIMSALSLQIQMIQDSLRRQLKEVDLHTSSVPLNENVALFITMNPGYAGRSHLPGNLKQLFRSITMTVPDRETIAEVMLFAEGFHTAEHLSRKVVPLFRLCDHQFSKQSHYDFGLRALKSVLVAAGKRKRQFTKAVAKQGQSREMLEKEESNFMLTCIIENVAPKLVTSDVSLFYPLLKDFFPCEQLPDIAEKDLHDAVLDVCQEAHLAASPEWVEKICQLHTTKAGRHGIMMVGPSGTGKTTAWKVLMAATVRADPTSEVQVYVIEPKVLSKTELFGSLDVTTREWRDGVFSAILRSIIEAEHEKKESQQNQKKCQQWIIFDGDVDPEWVENLNSVLDDNRILTLPSGERLALPPTTRIIFEVEGLKYATPATVSRCGMLWFSEGVIPLACVLTHSYQQMERKPLTDVLGHHMCWEMEDECFRLAENPKRDLCSVNINRGKKFNQYIAFAPAPSDVLEEEEPLGDAEGDEGGFPTQAASTLCNGSADARRLKSEIVTAMAPAFGRGDVIAKGIALVCSPAYRKHCIMELNVLQLLQGVLAYIWEGIWRCLCAEQESGGTYSPVMLSKVAEKLVSLAVVWGLGASLPYEHRERLAAELRLDVGSSHGNSILELEVDFCTGEWKPVRQRVKTVNIIAEQVGASETVIPTVDTVRHQDVLASWVGCGRSAILCGPPGSGKTMSINAVLSHSPEYEAVFLNFSSGTTVTTIIKSLEQYCSLRNTAKGYVMSPSSEKRLLLFCDEINLPALDTYGTQPVLQILRQLIEAKGFFRARDNTWIHVEGVQVVGACNPPTDLGRIPLPHRFSRWAPVLFVDFPSQESLHVIYSTYCRAVLFGCPGLSTQCPTQLASAMVKVYLQSQQQFTPLQRPHYLYSPRELSRWSRAIYEGLLTWADVDRKAIKEEALVRLAVHEGLRVFSDRLVTAEECDWTDSMMNSTFQEFFSEVPLAAYDRPVLYSTLLSHQYVDGSREELREVVTERLKAFCAEEVSISLVVFDSMIDHLVRLDRVLRQPLGHMLMAGSSGVGKSIIARLAAWMRGYAVFWLQIHRDYDLAAFEEDLRVLMRRTGCKGERVCFIFDESNVMEPSFLEYMNALLASGEVPGLFEGEEWVKLMQDIRDSVSMARAAQGKDRAALPHLSTATDQDLYHWFLQNVREKLHVVFTINPTSEEFSNRAVASPALFNRCTIDWYGDWDRETLLHIARARLQDLTLMTEECDRIFETEEDAHEAVASALCSIHQVTMTINAKARSHQGNRGTFITPRHFTDLVNHFVRLFNEKCEGSTEQRLHLRNGLQKLDETSRDIELQRAKLKESETRIAESSRSAQSMLDRIVSETDTTTKEKQVAEELRGQLQVEEARIIEDKSHIENDLSRVEPALREAEAALNTVKPEYLREIRAYSTPPPMVQRVLEAVLSLMGEKNCDDWDTVKGHMRREDFLSGVKAFKPTDVTGSAHEKVTVMLRGNLKVDAAYRASKAAGPLLQWVVAQVDYVSIYQKLQPLQKKVEELTLKHAEKLKALKDTEQDIGAKEAFLAKLKEEYQETTEQIADLKHSTNMIAAKCERATTILGQLLDEQSRWEEEVKTADGFSQTKAGDCILSACFLAYIGFFDEGMREKGFLPQWSQLLQASSIPTRPHLSILHYLTPPSLQLEWEQHGLPTDQLCAENTMIMHFTQRFPLLIDPTGSAARFLQSLYASKKITKASFSRPGYLKQLEMAVRFGFPIILEDAELLDPAVTPLLNQEYRQSGGRRITRIGAHDAELSASFQLFLLTRDPNYQPSPTLSGQTTPINFTVTQSSLYSQCLHYIVLHERPDVDRKRSELLKTKGEYQLRLRALEQKLLTTIGQAEGSLLENDQAIETLASLKTEARSMHDDIQNSDAGMKLISVVEYQFRPLAQVISSTFFALNRFSELASLYRYSVDFIFRVLRDSLSSLPTSPVNATRSLDEELGRIRQLTTAVFTLLHVRIRRGMLLEDHLVLALRLAQLRSSACTSLEVMGDVDQLLHDKVAAAFRVEIKEEEWAWLLQTLKNAGVNPSGGSPTEAAFPPLLQQLEVLPESRQLRSGFAALLQLPPFRPIASSLANPSHAEQWRVFFQSPSPISQAHQLPVLQEDSVSQGRRVFILSLLLFYTRRDSFYSTTQLALQLFFDTEVNEAVGPFFGLQTHSVGEALPELSSITPMLIVYDPSYDPSTSVELLARDAGASLRTVAMGSVENVSSSEKYVEEGIQTGCWVLLKNVHLAKVYLAQMEKYLYSQRLEGRIHPNFRLFLTVERSAGLQKSSVLPANLLADSLVSVFEAPPGIKASLLQTFKSQGSRTDAMVAMNRPAANGFQRLLLVLAWLHAVLTERLFYVPLGWSHSYEFSDAEYLRVVQAIESWSTASQTSESWAVDWVALRAVIAETVYGGKISNPFDQEVIDVICRKALNDSVWENDHPIMPTASTVAPPPLKASLSRSQLLDWIAALPDGRSPPQWLGLPCSVSRVLLSRQATQIAENLALVQQTLSAELPSTPATANASTVVDVSKKAMMKEVTAWRQELEQLSQQITKHTMVQTSPSGNAPRLSAALKEDSVQPLILAVQREKETSECVIRDLLADLVELYDVLLDQQKPSAQTRALMDDLERDIVPKRWRSIVTTHVPSLSLQIWKLDLMARLTHSLRVVEATVEKRLPSMAIQLGLLFSPEGLLTAFKQQYARESHVQLENLVPRVKVYPQVSPSASPPGWTPSSGGACASLLFKGLTLCGAQVNGLGKAELIDGDSASVAALTSRICVEWSWELASASSASMPLPLRLRQQASSGHVVLPLYVSDSRDVILDVLDIEVSAGGSHGVGEWYERGACIAAWSLVD